jgi:predicted ABC-type ATPase
MSTCWIIAGPNGSGKTTITEQLLRHIWMQACVYINHDLIAHAQVGSWNDPKLAIRKGNFPQSINNPIRTPALQIRGVA